MKKFWIGVTAFLAIIVIIVVVTPISVPRVQTYTQKFEGVLYQLGEENKDFIEPIEIYLDGSLYTDILGRKKFKGIVDINDEDLSVPKEQRKLEIKFQENNSIWTAYLYYHYYYQNDYGAHVFGTLYTDDDFSKITIAKSVSNNEGGTGWNGKDGYMISAPAASRESALKITNELAGTAWEYEFK